MKQKPRMRRSKFSKLIHAIVLCFCLIHATQRIPVANAGLLKSASDAVFNWVQGGAIEGSPTEAMNILDISVMRVRDIKRRLVRTHGYGADEIAKMMDKKELINALAFEEHRMEQKETDRKKRVALRRSIIVALICIIVVMFRPLIAHAWEVLCVNIEVYTDKKRYEFSRIKELQSSKGAFGLLLMVILDTLRLWLSISVILSWVMKSKYFFPVPHIPIRPAALISAATGNTGGAGPLGQYGMNVGPMAISWLFRFLNGRLEYWTGKALAQSLRRQKKQQKSAQKAARKEEEKKEAAIAKEERKAARKARRAERELRKKAAEAAGPGESVEEKAKAMAESTTGTGTTSNTTSTAASSQGTEQVQDTSQAPAMDELD
mmetsp:Transcript_14911/g.22343  ORF Transcript_14911/g.22343 Transcript_14911/m.22343 type:complete len:376 (-) Transcript_14911:22-1149(-)